MEAENINEFSGTIKNKINALTNTSFELTANIARTSIAVKKISMNLTKMKNLIARQEDGAAEADKSLDLIKANIANKKVPLSVVETLVKQTEEFIKASRETLNCLNEVAAGVNLVNSTVVKVNDMSVENNNNLTKLKQEMEKIPYADESKTKKILLVDDDDIHLTLTSSILENDYEVTTANSGEEALSLFYEGLVPDIILLDLIMPNMDGWDTFERIKAISALHHVPIAFFTSTFDIEEIKRAFDIGVDDYISKPVEKDELMKTITGMLKKAK